MKGYRYHSEGIPPCVIKIYYEDQYILRLTHMCNGSNGKIFSLEPLGDYVVVKGKTDYLLAEDINQELKNARPTFFDKVKQSIKTIKEIWKRK